MEVPDDERVLLTKGNEIADAKSEARTSRATLAQGADLVWRDLSYSVMMKVKNVVSEKPILKNLTGVAKRGEMLAIMGPSGAGKTSFLNLLALRIPNNSKNRISGDIRVNDAPYDYKKFNQIATYVLQNDVLTETLTVWETLMFVAKLKIEGTLQEKKNFAKEIIQQLRLERCSNTYVGGQFLKGISGGERKRTSIGVELISSPDIIMLDEPTSGLDSFTALIIIDVLKKQSLLGRNIIFTIHQPNYDIFKRFDRLILLANGETVYQGPTKAVLDHFSSLGFPCPVYSNPADFLMSRISNEYDETHKVLPKFYDAYVDQIHPKIEQDIKDSKKNVLVEKNYLKNSVWTQFSSIYQRSFLNFIRNPNLIRTRIIQTIFTSVLFSVLYYRICDNSELYITQNIGGALFFVCIGMFMSSLGQVQLTFPIERAVFLRETNSGLYSSYPYFFAKLANELPFVIVFPSIFASVSYGFVGLSTVDVWRFYIFMLICILQSLIGNSLGLMVGAIFSNPTVAAAMSPIFLLPFMIFAGFYQNQADYPVWISWMQYISPFKYALEALYRNQFYDLGIQPDPIQLMGFTIGMWQCIGILGGISLATLGVASVFLRVLVKRIQ